MRVIIKINRRQKITGLLGTIRFILMILGAFLWLFGFCIISEIFTFIFGGITFYNGILIFLILNIVGTSYILLKKQYYIRPINDEEYNDLLNKKLIHYTNYLNEDMIKEYNTNNEVEIDGNYRARANYSMTWKDAKNKYVWFHVSRLNDEEPELKSFISSHLLESKPRKYKILISPKNMNKDLIFIRPSDKAIVLKGRYKGQGLIKTEFEWYNKKIYFKESLFSTDFETFILSIFIVAKQSIGSIRDIPDYFRSN